MITGQIRKLCGEAANGHVKYRLPLGEIEIPLNACIGETLGLTFNGKIHCISCGRLTKKSYSQGHCFPCSQRLAACDLCIVKPEQCHYDQGTCREPAWGEAHCMQPHYVYLANSSGLKVGITRATQIPTRWIDQGATQALPFFRVNTRKQSGLLEILFKQHLSDKTDWRKLLKGEPEELDLVAQRDALMQRCAQDIAALQTETGEDQLTPLPNETMQRFSYPVTEYPQKIQSLNFDKTPQIQDRLLGIKGQYLIFAQGVLNVRKFTGYDVSFIRTV